MSLDPFLHFPFSVSPSFSGICLHLRFALSTSSFYWPISVSDFFGFWLWTFCQLNPSLYSGFYPENVEFQLSVSSGTQISCLALQDKCSSASFLWLCSTLFAVAHGRRRILVPSNAVCPLCSCTLACIPVFQHSLWLSIFVFRSAL